MKQKKARDHVFHIISVVVEEKLLLMTQTPSVSGRLLFKIVGVVMDDEAARARETPPLPKSMC